MRKLTLSEREKYIIERYAEDEERMVLLFAQWCVNNGLDAAALYNEAYPGQPKNKTLMTAMEQTIPKNQSGEISKELLIEVLQAFGNDDLAFVVNAVKPKKQSN